MADETETETDRESVPVSNVGYAAVPEGYVFVPGTTGGNDLLRALFDAADDPETIITRAGYGYVVPEAVAEKAGVKTVDVVQVIDPSTPDTTPAKDALDTQDSPITTASDAEIEAAQDGPLEIDFSNPASDEYVAPDETAATTPEAEGETAPETPAPTGKKGSAASAAS